MVTASLKFRRVFTCKVPSQISTLRPSLPLPRFIPSQFKVQTPSRPSGSSLEICGVWMPLVFPENWVFPNPSYSWSS